MELRHLEQFVAVAEERHFTRAAERLHVAQSGLSAAVRSLERELKVDLFARTTRRVELTDAGRALLVEARRTLASAAAAREAVAAVCGLLRGRLAVGTEQCLGALDPVALLAELRTRHPGVQVDLVQAGSAQLLDRLRAGRLDVAFVADDDDREGVRLTEIASEPMTLLCRADHPMAQAAEPIAWEKLGDEVFVDFPTDWGSRQVTDRAFAAAGVRRRVAMQVGDVHMLLHLVGRGLGVAVVPRHISTKEQAQALCAIPMAGPVAWRVAVAVPAAGRPGPAAAALLDAVRQVTTPRGFGPRNPLQG